jgi:glyoxylase-like metal-dependent hydrolase (beta-lactamase superfamily II)
VRRPVDDEPLPSDTVRWYLPFTFRTGGSRLEAEAQQERERASGGPVTGPPLLPFRPLGLVLARHRVPHNSRGGRSSDHLPRTPEVVCHSAAAPPSRRSPLDVAADAAAAGPSRVAAAGAVGTRRANVGDVTIENAATSPPPVPPADPRATWDLPAFGQMPVVEELAAPITRVVAPNPSHMTLDGTNTYVLGAPGTGAVVVVDPGPEDADHLARVREVVDARDAEVTAIVVTHHHHDHTEAAPAWARAFGVPVHAPSRGDASDDGRVLVDGDRLDLPGLEVAVVATPGHCHDHVAFRVGDGSLLTGDHVLGRGTSVVAHPDGDLAAYLASLRRTLDLGADALHPGHGPSLTEDPDAVLRFYADHRDYRRAQILQALAAGPATPGELVAGIYAEVDRILWAAAEASTRATLTALEGEGVVRPAGRGRVELAAG